VEYKPQQQTISGSPFADFANFNGGSLIANINFYPQAVVATHSSIYRQALAVTIKNYCYWMKQFYYYDDESLSPVLSVESNVCLFTDKGIPYVM
jgi:hypothetical protein